MKPKPKNRGANGANGSKWLRPEKRLAIYLRDGFRCLWCEADLADVDPEERSVDHLEGREGEASNEPENLITACRPCNSSRQGRPWTIAKPEVLERIEQTRKKPLDVDRAKAILEARAKRMGKS